MRLRYIYGVFTVLLLAAPLAAQQVVTDTLGITVTRDIIVNGDSTFVSIDVLVRRESCDSACRDAAAQAQEDFVRAWLEREGGPSDVSVIADSGLTVAAFLIAWYLRGIKNKEHPQHSGEPEEPEEPEEGHGEGGGEH